MCPQYLSASWASHDVPGGPSGSPGTQRVARDPWSLIMVAVLRGSLPPTTDNSDLPKSQPDSITSARKLLTNRSYGVSYHLCSD